MKKTIIILFLLLTSIISANLNFGECSGSGTFKHHIDQLDQQRNDEDAIVVGEIPKGIKGLKIYLISDKDLDIRLYGSNNDKVVHWPNGILRQATEETKSYKGVYVTYSGYNGMDGKKGHEFIKVIGTVPTTMKMKVFGFSEGYATVNYSWTGKEGCTSNKKGVVLKTGQTMSAVDFDDGDYQKGKARSCTRDDAKEVVIDNATGLMWQDNSKFKTVKKRWVTIANYNAGKYNDTSGDTATTYCTNLTLGGYEDWRLPTRKELETLVDIGRYNPRVALGLNPEFLNFVSGDYWSSTTSVDRKEAWYSNFLNLHQMIDRKRRNKYVRCVRAGGN